MLTIHAMVHQLKYPPSRWVFKLVDFEEISNSQSSLLPGNSLQRRNITWYSRCSRIRKHTCLYTKL